MGQTARMHDDEAFIDHVTSALRASLQEADHDRRPDADRPHPAELRQVWLAASAALDDPQSLPPVDGEAAAAPTTAASSRR
jgi:hypothetical protein